MTRWSEAYKARMTRPDDIDIVDKIPRPPVLPGHNVNNVNNVTVKESGNDAASDAACEATEQAAIFAESESGNASASVPHRLPPSWGDARIEPTLGAMCHCCKGVRWWCETDNPNGWRCMACHPPAHLKAGRFRVVAT